MLVEGPSKSEKGDLSHDRVQGRTERSEIVHIDAPGAAALVGRIVEVEIARANKHSVAGVPLNTHFPARRATPQRRLPLTD